MSLAAYQSVAVNEYCFLLCLLLFGTSIRQTRVLWNTYPVHCCCMKLCETQLIAEEDYKFARTHTFALLTMVIAYCVQSSIYEYGPVELTAPCSS